jgi:hypothetical protein
MAWVGTHSSNVSIGQVPVLMSFGRSGSSRLLSTGVRYSMMVEFPVAISQNPRHGSSVSEGTRGFTSIPERNGCPCLLQAHFKFLQKLP